MKIKGSPFSDPNVPGLNTLKPGDCFRRPTGRCIYMLCTRVALGRDVRQNFPREDKVVVSLETGTLYSMEKFAKVIPLTMQAEVVEAPCQA